MSPTTPESATGAETLPPKRKNRIVFTLLAVLVLIGLAPLASVAWKLIDINREALTTSQQQFQLLLASSIGYEIDTHVEGLEFQLVRVAQTLGGSIGKSGEVREEEIRRILTDVVDERMVYLRFAYFQGRRTRVLQEAGLPADLEPVFATGLQKAVELLAPTASSRPQQAIVSPPILPEKRPRRAMLVISAPVVSRGRFRGVLSALVDLQRVWESTLAHNKSAEGYLIFALDESGRAFASTNPVRLQPGQVVSKSELVARFLVNRSREGGSETLPFVETVDGVERSFLGSYAKTNKRWGVFVQARQEESYWTVREMIQSTVTWALAVVGVAVLASGFFARTLSNPIKRLAAASRAFASGNYATRVRVRSSNEIGELAFTFNRMASEIEDQIRSLHEAAQENRELFLGTIRALAQAIDAKDPYTRGHSVRVNRYSVIVAKEMGLAEDRIGDVHVASLMHDVGKIGINDNILQKPGALTAEEFEIMRTHTVLGANIMAPIRKMEDIIPGLRSHHEKWKGGGYPDGLEGEEIPLIARIIAVADAFDAMTTNRPYQKAATFEEALEMLAKLKGLSFDGQVVEAFNRAFQRGLIVAEGGRVTEEPENADEAIPA